MSHLHKMHELRASPICNVVQRSRLCLIAALSPRPQSSQTRTVQLREHRLRRYAATLSSDYNVSICSMRKHHIVPTLGYLDSAIESPRFETLFVARPCRMAARQPSP